MKSLKPPPMATWLFEHARFGGTDDALLGDLLESFGQGRSATWYWRQVLAAIFFNWIAAIRKQWMSHPADGIISTETALIAVGGQPRCNANPAFWLAPLASTIPLIPFFSLPSSPLFLGKLMLGDAMSPFIQSPWGPWLAAAGVIFDGTILAYLMALSIYLFFAITREPLTARRVLVLFSLMGVFASQLVHGLQHFRQPGLSAFADLWFSPFFGLVCGLTSGACFALFANRRFSPAARALIYSLPFAVVVACGKFLVSSRR
jgi:hypothetical protein